MPASASSNFREALCSPHPADIESMHADGVTTVAALSGLTAAVLIITEAKSSHPDTACSDRRVRLFDTI